MITENVKIANEVTTSAAVSAEAEAEAFVQRVTDLFDEADALKPMARQAIARKLGQSVKNEKGRPGSVEYIAFLLATLRVSFKESHELASIANKAVSRALDGSKKLPVQVKISGNAGGEKAAKIRLNKPVELDGVWE